MAIGRTFKESLQKVIRSMDVKRFGLGLDRNDKWLAAMRAVERGDIVLDVMGDPSAVGAVGAVGVVVHDTPSPTGLRTADGSPIEWPIPTDKLSRKLAVPSQGRLYYVRYALKMGWTVERVRALTRIDPFFLDQIKELVEFEEVLCGYRTLDEVPGEVMFRAKQLGYSDAQLANLYLGAISPATILRVRRHRASMGIEPVFKLVDTCAAEFEARTPYFYSTYERGARTPSPAANVQWRGEDEARTTDRPKVVILGGGPNRVGQGIEFDYCCCHAAFAAKDLGFESVMVNSNPETVSTDYDTSDLLYFEPLTLEDTLNIIERLNGRALGQPGGLVKGVIVQFGGQTPLNLAHGLVAAGVPILGTSLDSIDLAEDRDRFDELLERLGLSRPPAGIARSIDEAVRVAGDLGYPVLIRPSYVLGGRGMEVCSDEKSLRLFITQALKVSDFEGAPVLIDKFLAGATEVDVDVVCDASGHAVVAGIMEHIEHAGIHSGDSACSLPPYSLPAAMVTRIGAIARSLAVELRVVGLMNLQLAIKGDDVFILEVNPRASRTVPFVSKATHVPWPAIAAKAMMGVGLKAQGVCEVGSGRGHAVKESVFPFAKFPGVDVVLGPEMRSTGEVMGLDRSFPVAFAKSQLAAGTDLPRDPSKGGVFISVKDEDKSTIVQPARELASMGFWIYATGGTADALEAGGVAVERLQKIAGGVRPNVLDLMTNREIAMIINTPTKTGYATDEGKIRATSVRLNIPLISTATAASAAARAIAALRSESWGVAALQDYAPAVAVEVAPRSPVGAVAG
ncbi:MAG: carbamoyl-phosphate synthase large subunit [Phycisphaeraceae bacterium]|nr:MAG: carbamoyl-phosphate synthase large subunit [Phycisphaeraceae bacterium]